MCKGLRFNAKKDRDGNYFSTTIYKFSTKCPSCEQQFIIRTDPKNATYEFVDGLRKMEQDYVPEPNDSLIESVSDEVKEQLTKDPIFRLQFEKEDRQKSELAEIHNYAIIELNEKISKNDYDNNSKLRTIHRTKKRRQKELLEEGSKYGLSIPLLEASESDVIESKMVSYQGVNNCRRIKEKNNILQLQSQSIFHPSVKTQKLSSSSRKNNNFNLISQSSLALVESKSTGGSSSQQPQVESIDSMKLKKYRQILTKQACSTLLSNIPKSAYSSCVVEGDGHFPVHTKHSPVLTNLTTSSANSGSCGGALALLSSYADESDDSNN